MLKNKHKAFNLRLARAERVLQQSMSQLNEMRRQREAQEQRDQQQFARIRVV